MAATEIDKATPGASVNVWGTKTNTALDTIVGGQNTHDMILTDHDQRMEVIEDALPAKLSPTSPDRDALNLADYAKLRPWYAAVANRANRAVNVAYVGASLTEGLPVTSFDKTAPNRLAYFLNTRHPTPGLAKTGRGFIGVPTAVVLAAGWPQVYTGGTFDDYTLFQFGAKHRYWYGTGTDKVVHTFTEGVTSFNIHIIAGSSGHATGGYYKINGGAAVPFSTLNASTVGRLINVVQTLAAGSTLEIGRTAGATLIFTGVREFNTDETKGFQVHNFGHASYSAVQWTVGAGTSPSWLTEQAAFNPDLVIKQDFGVNDGYTGNGNKTGAQFKTDMLANIAADRAAGITCPMVLAAAYDVTAAFAMASSWSAYVTAMKEIAAADNTVVFFDHSARMPAWSSSNPYGLYTSNVDPHSNPNGSAYMWMAENIYTAIRPR